MEQRNIVPYVFMVLLGSTYACPGSPASQYASCKFQIVASTSCDKAKAEIVARIEGNLDGTWKDPHNGGAYNFTEPPSRAATVHASRTTGKAPHYLDLFDFTFTTAGTSCTIEACSDSQSPSLFDASTNYCNLRNLYCGKEVGCKPLLHDFQFLENATDLESTCTSKVLQQHDSANCIVATPTLSVSPQPTMTRHQSSSPRNSDDVARQNVRLTNGLVFPRASFGLQVYSNELAKQYTLMAISAGFRNFFASVLAKNQIGFGQAVATSNIPRGDLFVCGSVNTGGCQGFSACFEQTKEGWLANVRDLNVGGLDMIMLDYPANDCEGIAGQWAALEDMLAHTKTKSLAVSNFNDVDLQCILQNKSATVPVLNQLPFSVASGPQHEKLRLNRQHGIVVQAYSPLSRVTNHDVLAEIGLKYTKSWAQVALRWVLQHNVTFSTQSTSLIHFKEDLDVFDFTLSVADMSVLDGDGDVAMTSTRASSVDGDDDGDGDDDNDDDDDVDDVDDDDVVVVDSSTQRHDSVSPTTTTTNHAVGDVTTHTVDTHDVVTTTHDLVTTTEDVTKTDGVQMSTATLPTQEHEGDSSSSPQHHADDVSTSPPQHHTGDRSTSPSQQHTATNAAASSSSSSSSTAEEDGGEYCGPVGYCAAHARCVGSCPPPGNRPCASVTCECVVGYTGDGYTKCTTTTNTLTPTNTITTPNNPANAMSTTPLSPAPPTPSTTPPLYIDDGSYVVGEETSLVWLIGAPMGVVVFVVLFVTAVVLYKKRKNSYQNLNTADTDVVNAAYNDDVDDVLEWW